MIIIKKRGEGPHAHGHTTLQWNHGSAVTARQPSRFNDFSVLLRASARDSASAPKGPTSLPATFTMPHNKPSHRQHVAALESKANALPRTHNAPPPFPSVLCFHSPQSDVRQSVRSVSVMFFSNARAIAVAPMSPSLLAIDTPQTHTRGHRVSQLAV